MSMSRSTSITMSLPLSMNYTRLTATATSSTIKPATTFICSQCRHATLLRRPKRPYTFTQLITLSDGSTFTHRTTSPAPVYRSTRDTRNSLLWNPSSNKLMNIEEDEAGRLAAFRAKFGRSWDANTTASEAAATSSGAKDNKASADAKAKEAAEQRALEEEEDNLLDLISSFGQEMEQESSSKKKKK